MFQFNSTRDSCSWSQRPQTIIQDSSFGHTNLHKLLHYRKAHPLLFYQSAHMSIKHWFTFIQILLINTALDINKRPDQDRTRPVFFLLCVTLRFYTSLELKAMKCKLCPIIADGDCAQMRVDLNVRTETRNKTDNMAAYLEQNKQPVLNPLRCCLCCFVFAL